MGSSASSDRRRQQQQQTQVIQQQRQPPPQPPLQQQQQPPQQQQQLRSGPTSAYPPPQHQQMQPPYQSPPPQQAVSEAVTIKNECTVLTETVAYDRTASLLTFRTMCNIPCEMEVHVAVRVDILHGNCMITPNKPKAPPPRIPVEAGDHSHEVCIDLTNVTPQEQTYVTAYPFQLPVVVALYYPCPDAPTTVNIEYTMIQLVPVGKMVKQLIRAKDGVYKIEHLFGGEHADVGTVVAEDGVSPTSGENVATAVVEDDEDGLCVICLTNEKNTVVMPCRHLCLCKECAEELRQRGPKCPVCRGPIAQLVAVRSN